MSNSALKDYKESMSRVEKFSKQWFDIAFLLFACFGDSIVVIENEESVEYNDYFQAELCDFFECITEKFAR